MSSEVQSLTLLGESSEQSTAIKSIHSKTHLRNSCLKSVESSPGLPMLEVPYTPQKNFYVLLFPSLMLSSEFSTFVSSFVLFLSFYLLILPLSLQFFNLLIVNHYLYIVDN